MINSLDELKQLLSSKSDFYILKFSSSHCAPCMKIKAMAEQHMDNLEKLYNRVKCINISIDENMQLYGELKRRKIVNGIPVIMAYDARQIQEIWYQPLEIVMGGKEQDINLFFSICEKNLA